MQRGSRIFIELDGLIAWGRIDRVTRQGKLWVRWDPDNPLKISYTKGLLPSDVVCPADYDYPIEEKAEQVA